MPCDESWPLVCACSPFPPFSFSVRILINAISIREGGSKVVLLNFLKHFSDFHEHTFYVCVNRSAHSWQLPVSSNLKYIFADWACSSFAHLVFWYHVTLPFLLRKHSIDTLFSLTNYLPVIPLRCKSLLLVQHAGHFSDCFRECLKEQNNGFAKYLSFSLKSAWVYVSVYRATAVTVQTEALRQAIVSSLRICPDKIYVIPHGPGLIKNRSKPRSLALSPPVYSIGYVAKPGVQKNFFPLVGSLRVMQAKGFNVRLHLTMPHDHPQTHAIISHSKSIGVDRLIINHGDIGGERVNSLYRDIDIFVFPSLCESFGFPLIEAMCSALPTIVSDTSSNLELAPSGSPSFAAHDCYSIAASIIKLLSSPVEYSDASKASLKRSRDFSWDTASLKTLKLLHAL